MERETGTDVSVSSRGTKRTEGIGDSGDGGSGERDRARCKASRKVVKDVNLLGDLEDSVSEASDV